jgi:hypothetical protein
MTQNSQPIAQPTTSEKLRSRVLTGLAATAFGLIVFAVGSPLVQFAGMFIALVIAYEWSAIIRGTNQPSIASVLMFFGVGLTVFATGYGAFWVTGIGMAVLCGLTAIAAWNNPTERLWLPLGILYAAVPMVAVGRSVCGWWDWSVVALYRLVDGDQRRYRSLLCRQALGRP